MHGQEKWLLKEYQKINNKKEFGICIINKSEKLDK